MKEENTLHWSFLKIEISHRREVSTILVMLTYLQSFKVGSVQPPYNQPPLYLVGCIILSVFSIEFWRKLDTWHIIDRLKAKGQQRRPKSLQRGIKWNLDGLKRSFGQWALSLFSFSFYPLKFRNFLCENQTWYLSCVRNQRLVGVALL